MNTNFSSMVSIIIPSYNHSKFIGKALKSILDQSYQNWEAIIIDNYSTDHTDDVLRKFSDTRFKVFKIKNNGIIAKSRNLGIKFAKGEWIAFLDSDDWWTFDKLETCLRNINDEVDLIYHDLEIKYDKPKFKFRKISYKGRQLTKPILQNLLYGLIEEGNAIGNSSVLVRKKILLKVGGINENKNLVAAEDFNTWLKIAQITDKFKYLNKKLGFYLVHDVSAQKKDLSIPHKEAVKEFLYLYNNKQKLNYEVKLRYMSASYNAQNNNLIKARKDFMFVFKKGSLNLKLRSIIKIIIIMIQQIKS